MCTGQVGGKDSLSHYGLGLQKYTHFTSPIRRYADVVVHKQLLMLCPDSEHKKSAPSVELQVPLSDLPTSKTISILGGEGLNDQTHEGTSDTVPALQLEEEREKSVPTDSASNIHAKNTNQGEEIYQPHDVTKICSVLNYQNRMAKVCVDFTLNCTCLLFYLTTDQLCADVIHGMPESLFIPIL